MHLQPSCDPNLELDLQHCGARLAKCTSVNSSRLIGGDLYAGTMLQRNWIGQTERAQNISMNRIRNNGSS